MTIQMLLLDHVHTVGLGADPILPGVNNLKPNDFVYFCGLIIALLTQMLVIYDLFVNYSICSQFFIWSKWKDVQYLVKRFSLKATTTAIIDYYYWQVALTFFFIELFFCIICYYFFNKTLLFLSVFIWTISFLFSFFSVTAINFYIRSKEDLMVALRIRDGKMFLLEKEIETLIIQWRIEEMEKNKENFDESMVTKRVEEYRDVKMKVIDEILNTKNTFLLDTLNNVDFQYEGTPYEWIWTPTHLNFINISLYFYYLYVCCQDSIFLYNILYPLFGYPYAFDPSTSSVLENSENYNLSFKILLNAIFFGF